MHVNNVYFVYIFLIRKLRQAVLDYLAVWPVTYLQYCYLFPARILKSSY